MTFGHNCFSGSLPKMVKRTNFTVNDHQKLKDFLLERFEHGHLRRRSITQGAVLVSITHVTVSRLWLTYIHAQIGALNTDLVQWMTTCIHFVNVAG
jgi:hypothetical protein